MKNRLAEKLDIDPIELLKSKYPGLSNRDLVQIVAEQLEVELQNDPVQKIHELEDSPDKMFLWSMDMTDTQVIEFTQKVYSEFVQKYNRDPQSLHLIRNDVDGVESLSPDEVRERVEPWLNQKDEGGNNGS